MGKVSRGRAVGCYAAAVVLACLAVAALCLIPDRGGKLIAVIPAGVSIWSYIVGRMCIKDAAIYDEEDRAADEFEKLSPDAP
jgi:hypothetical protein